MRLDELLQRHVAWSAEIKNLDSDMQMLVYENYNKFIRATDTIRRYLNPKPETLNPGPLPDSHAFQLTPWQRGSPAF